MPMPGQDCQDVNFSKADLLSAYVVEASIGGKQCIRLRGIFAMYPDSGICRTESSRSSTYCGTNVDQLRRLGGGFIRQVRHQIWEARRCFISLRPVDCFCVSLSDCVFVGIPQTKHLSLPDSQANVLENS